MTKLKHHYPKLQIFVKSLFYTQTLIIFAILLSYWLAKEYDNPFENIGAVVNKIFFISTIPTILSMLWIVYKEYTRQDEAKVFAALSIIWFINIGILINVNIPFYNSINKFSGGSLAIVIPLFIIPRLLPKT
ncbi:hypothetical protein [Rodentibacter pneumotropicus]|uniref:Uncharacterized protein n=4 Tax=Rodentibacter pneumotropicus TaxID=758 RepID=A0AAW5LDQ3_9PAST|nr:hypothetical protein [Rodentibacter pneumotropicus]MCQ9122148.1 hypothetical protein [Rodentibacter pneumotropicus]NBH76059.1 hypothetical protein [Rodentibacter pneumotropicus]OOF64435.1 hypothetical protein BH925_06360 [Rodentibacter pneumotropicus]OOF67796.1 hypothetical protein BKG95_06180 [Rodentibacter pneumotropicus]THA01820.1 hypothetical protein D3M79_01230 [Rodentibacter pneumotropicus]